MQSPYPGIYLPFLFLTDTIRSTTIKLSNIRQRLISKTYTHVKILTQHLNLNDLLSCLHDGASIHSGEHTTKLILPFIRCFCINRVATCRQQRSLLNSKNLSKAQPISQNNLQGAPAFVLSSVLLTSPPRNTSIRFIKGQAVCASYSQTVNIHLEPDCFPSTLFTRWRFGIHL